MSSGSALLVPAIARLRAAGVPDPARDARRLLAHALGVAPERLTLVLPDPVGPEAAAAFADLIAARAARRPVSHLVGTRAFFGRDFIVSGDVLDPRPETETLIAAALARDWQSVLDLGTGSGAILLTLLAERPGATGLGIDVSGPALAVAARNRAHLGLDDRAALRPGDWLDGVTGRFDLIVCNPPYIPETEYAALEPEPRLWEPRLALTPGADGLAVYRDLAPKLGQALTPGGTVLFEVGAGQAAAVAAMLRGAGFPDVRCLADLDGRDRVVCATLAPENR